MRAAVGAKMWCLYVSFYRQDAAKRQTAGIKFTHRPKISIFALCTDISRQSVNGGGNATQKYQNFPLFW